MTQDARCAAKACPHLAVESVFDRIFLARLCLVRDPRLDDDLRREIESGPRRQWTIASRPPAGAHYVAVAATATIERHKEARASQPAAVLGAPLARQPVVTPVDSQQL